MHARELVELAAIISAHGPVLVRGRDRVSECGIEQYWVASKCRLDRWSRALKSLDVREVARPASSQGPRTAVRSFPEAMLEEILTGEVLTRVWGAVLSAYDRRRGTQEVEPIARSVLIGHLEARHRVLTLLVRASSIDTAWAMRLNGIRRRCERWTDLLVGYLTGLEDVADFAIEPERARDFAEDLHYRSNLAGGRHAWPLVLSSLRAAFQQGLAGESPNSDLNGQIASSILACFPAELFDSTGMFRSLWLMRLTNMVGDTQGMLDSLVAMDSGGPSLPETTASRLSQRSRRAGW
ncbi:MAG: hypothetical protein U1E05_19760 [Patescibacteria group bacterium]|nr:hypothetical protein [Patescibacteria group bacterium]